MVDKTEYRLLQVLIYFNFSRSFPTLHFLHPLFPTFPFCIWINSIFTEAKFPLASTEPDFKEAEVSVSLSGSRKVKTIFNAAFVIFGL